MKIVILDIDDLKNPHWGSGQARATREIFKRLSKNNTITVYCSKYPGYKDYVVNGVNYKHIGVATDNQQLNNIMYIFSSLFTIPKINADIILENFTAPISANLSPLLTKTPIVGLGSFFSADKLSAKYHLPFSVVEKYFSKTYKYFIALNSADEQKMKSLNKNVHTTVIPNGIEDEIFNIRTTENQSILFFGRIDFNQKGLDLLLEAYQKISEKIKDKLYIVGKGDSENESRLNSLIKRGHLNSKVIFLGKKHRKDVLRLLSQSKIVVMPSRYEGQSLSALESLALGKPIVCFDIPGFNWLTRKSAIKVKPFDIQKFSESLLNLSLDRELREKICQQSRKLAKRFTWEKSAKKYEAFFDRIYQI